MVVPDFLLRKIFRTENLRWTPDGRFALTLENPIGEATLLAPPRIVANGAPVPVLHTGPVRLADVGPHNPHTFRRGDTLTISFVAPPLAAGNVVSITAETAEFGAVEFTVRDA